MFCRLMSRKRKTGSVPVYLNVYDLTPMNGYAYWLGLGIYHSGVQGLCSFVFFFNCLFSVFSRTPIAGLMVWDCFSCLGEFDARSVVISAVGCLAVEKMEGNERI